MKLSQQLRIGNMVMHLYDGPVVITVSHLYSLCRVETTVPNQTLYQGIPITPEWLEKIGFYVDKFGNSTFIVKRDPKGWHSFKLYRDSEGYYIRANKYARRRVADLHTLQNVFYSLFEREL